MRDFLDELMKEAVVHADSLLSNMLSNCGIFCPPRESFKEMTSELQQTRDFVASFSHVVGKTSLGRWLSERLDFDVQAVLQCYAGGDPNNVASFMADWFKLAKQPRCERRRSENWERLNILGSSLFGLATHALAVQVATAVTGAITRAWQSPGSAAAASVDLTCAALPIRMVDVAQSVVYDKPLQGGFTPSEFLMNNCLRKVKLLQASRMTTISPKGEVIDLTPILEGGLTLVKGSDRFYLIGGQRYTELPLQHFVCLDDTRVGLLSLLARLSATVAEEEVDDVDSTPRARRFDRLGRTASPRFVFSIVGGPWFRPQKTYRRRFTVEEVARIRTLSSQGYSVRQIVSQLESEWHVRLFASSIYKVCAHETYKYNSNLMRPINVRR